MWPKDFQHPMEYSSNNQLLGVSDNSAGFNGAWLFSVRIDEDHVEAVAYGIGYQFNSINGGFSYPAVAHVYADNDHFVFDLTSTNGRSREYVASSSGNWQHIQYGDSYIGGESGGTFKMW
jgi:hypothetical protein